MVQPSMFWQKNQQFYTPVKDAPTIIGLDDRAFLYGDGCFTTVQVKNGQTKLWARHLARLQCAIDALCIEVSLDSLEQDLTQFFAAIIRHQPDDSFSSFELTGILKIIISRGSSPRGYSIPAHAADYYFCFYPQSINQQPSTLATVGVIEQPLADEFAPIRGLKTLNRLAQVWLKHYANQQNWHEALTVNRRGHIVEGIASNVFFLCDDVWCTPDLALTGIHGVMRQEILSRLQQCQIAHQVGAFSIQQVQTAQAIFFCNSLHPMQMVQHLTLQNNQPSVLHYPLNQVKCRQLFERLALGHL